MHLVTSLAEIVDLLIKENRQLKRALARAEKARVSGDLRQAAKALSGLQRRLTRALDSPLRLGVPDRPLLRWRAAGRDARLLIPMC